MSRTSHIKTNMKYNIIKYVIQILLKFLLQTMLVHLMGAEYIGLNGLFTNIFSILNLAELGIGSAIVFSMYKPVAENNVEKIKSLQTLYKRFYFIIVCVIVTLGVCINPFLPHLINGTVDANINIYLLFNMYLFNTILSYLSAHKRSLIFAYQRNDIENKIKSLSLILMTLIQIFVLLILKNYYIFYVVNIIFTIIENVIIRAMANKLFPQISGKAQPLDSTTKKEISKNVSALSLHKIGSAVVYSTDNILISSMFGIILLGAYSNYSLIITTLTSIYILISDALLSSIGNLIATCDKEIVYNKYKQINFLFSILTSFITICLIVLFQPFIKVWTGGGIYLLNYSTVILLSLSFYLNKMRSGILLFRDGAGLFWQNRIAPIFEALINLAASIVLGIFIGINGVVIGTIISTLIVPLWVEPKIVYKHYFDKNVWDYFKQYLIDVIIMILVGSICYFVCSFIPDSGIWMLIVKFLTCISLCGISLIIAYSPTKEFKELFSMGKGWIKNILHKNKND